ncbi:MAG: hypothetical protein Tsb0016_05150 [Sphingomonadales bacterium]
MTNKPSISPPHTGARARLKRAWLGTALAGFMLAGCNAATTVSDASKPQLAAIEAGEALVFLSRHQLAANETEADFVDCVGNSLARQNPDIRVISQQQFIDGMYPYFEANTAPTNVESLNGLTQDPAVRARMADMNVRYLVWLNGNTETVDRGGSFSCAVGPGGGGCLGWTKWKDQGSYEAIVWDLKSLSESGSFNIETSGTSHLVGVLVPVPLLARVESEACEAAAQRLALSMQEREQRSIIKR